MDDLTPTRSVLLELKEESQSMREAYSFLDEKRMLLAGTLVEQVSRYDEARRAFEESFALAALVLREAIAWHGLESLQCRPAPGLDPSLLTVSKSSILGVSLFDAELTTGTEDVSGTSRVAQRCARHFRELTRQAAHLAALSGNLMRLYQEYQRTERRARALEDVLLPELEETTRQIDGHLEALAGGGGADQVYAECVTRFWKEVLSPRYLGWLASAIIETLREPQEMAGRSKEWESAATPRTATPSWAAPRCSPSRVTR